MYLDELLLLNFAIDYCLLSTLSKILKINVTNKKILLGSLVGEISILYLFLNTGNIILWLFKIIVSLIMLLVSFGYKDKTFFSSFIISFTKVCNNVFSQKSSLSAIHIKSPLANENPLFH